MTPVAFDGCFGWFHPGGAARGVVLCGPVGEEADYVYGAWRELAERLAQGGVSTLRFDYPGLGNSLDLEEGRDAATAWVESIKAAVAWLRREAGIDDVAIAGMRLGAGLGLRCAQEMGGVSRLALIAPAVSGAAFQRELELMSMLSKAKGPSPDGADPSVVATVFTAERTFDVSRLRFSHGDQTPAPRVFILSNNASEAECALSARLATLGADVTEQAFDGYGALMVQPEAAVYPKVAFGKLVDWMCEGLDVETTPLTTGARGHPFPAGLTPPGAQEIPVSIRNGAPLLGILCKPTFPRAGRPGILFLNTGAVPQSGTNRIWVTMARRCAAIGFTALRFDISGVGDSPGHAARTDNRPIMKDACADVAAAIGWLQAQNCSTITLIGFCWGAQLAFNVALEDSRIGRLIMINSPRQFWQLETDEEPQRSLATYLRLTRDIAKWKGLFKGKISPGELAQFIGQMILVTVQSTYQRAAGVEDLSVRVKGMMHCLYKRGVQTGFFHGDDDTFLSEFEDYFRTNRRGLARLLKIHTHFFPGVQHRFANDASLAALVRAVSDYLTCGGGAFEPTVQPRNGSGARGPPQLSGAGPRH
jgi:pimeloyl-ACP methyl ester carboxylesterase